MITPYHEHDRRRGRVLMAELVDAASTGAP
jgi:hypothetical protein